MNTNKQEKIVCAAIRTIGTDGKCERCLISVGVDYHFIQEQEGYENIHDIESILSEVRGFITNKNRFVDPVEAMSIAINNNQIRELSNLHTRWIEWQLVEDERWKDVHECWREMKDKLESRELKPEDLY